MTDRRRQQKPAAAYSKRDKSSDSVILSIESSCDDTAVAIVQGGRRILSGEIASQIEMHRIYGGVVPEIASRKHAEVIEGL